MSSPTFLSGSTAPTNLQSLFQASVDRYYTPTSPLSTPESRLSKLFDNVPYRTRWKCPLKVVVKGAAMMEEIRMSRKERTRLVKLRQVLEGKERLKDARAKPGGSRRNARRKLKRFRKEGDAGLVHRSRGRPSNRAKPPEMKEAVLWRMMRQAGVLRCLPGRSASGRCEEHSPIVAARWTGRGFGRSASGRYENLIQRRISGMLGRLPVISTPTR